jgi:peroxiredoxin
MHGSQYLAYISEFLEPIKEMYPSASYADIWTLAGVVAIESMGGPKIPWSPGRVDKRKETLASSDVPPNGRLPDVFLIYLILGCSRC